MALIFVGGNYLKKQFDFGNPDTVTKLLLGYITSNILFVLALLFIRARVSAAPRVGADGIDIDNEQGVTIVNPGNPFTAVPPTTSHSSIRAYDISQVHSQLQGTVVGVFFMLLLHRWIGAVQPLIMQTVVPWKGFLTSQLVRIWAYGEEPNESLRRPFQPPKSPLADLFKQEEGGEAQEPRVQEVVDEEPAEQGSQPAPTNSSWSEDDNEFDVPPKIEIQPAKPVVVKEQVAKQETSPAKEQARQRQPSKGTDTEDEDAAPVQRPKARKED